MSREVYEIDRSNNNKQLEAIKADLETGAKNRRQTVLFVIGSFVTSATALVTALIEVRAHP